MSQQLEGYRFQTSTLKKELESSMDREQSERKERKEWARSKIDNLDDLDHSESTRSTIESEIQPNESLNRSTMFLPKTNQLKVLTNILVYCQLKYILKSLFSDVGNQHNNEYTPWRISRFQLSMASQELILVNTELSQLQNQLSPYLYDQTQLSKIVKQIISCDGISKRRLETEYPGLHMSAYLHAARFKEEKLILNLGGKQIIGMCIYNTICLVVYY